MPQIRHSTEESCSDATRVVPARLINRSSLPVKETILSYETRINLMLHTTR